MGTDELYSVRSVWKHNHLRNVRRLDEGLSYWGSGGLGGRFTECGLMGLSQAKQQWRLRQCSPAQEMPTPTPKAIGTVRPRSAAAAGGEAIDSLGRHLVNSDVRKSLLRN